MEFMEVTPETLDQRCRYPESNDLGEILYGVDDVCHSVNEASLATVFITFHDGKSQFLMGKWVNQLYKWSFSIAILVYKRVDVVNICELM